MYKISGKVYREYHGKLKSRTDRKRKKLSWGKNSERIFQGDVLSLLFVITMMPQSHVFKKCAGGYKLHKSQEEINCLMYIDDIKLFAKNEKENWKP